MQVGKAVITAAGAQHRLLPLQRIVDVDSREKSALQIVVDEVVDAGINEIAIVVCDGDQDAYQDAAGPHASRLHFIVQHEPRGYGDAVLRCRTFADGRAFLHMVSDHLWLSTDAARRCAKQVVDVAREEACAVSAVQAARERVLPHYGVVGGSPVPQRPHLFEVERVLEKPTPTEAESHLVVAGLRAGWYLCLFGIHVLTPQVFDLLQDVADAAAGATAAETNEGRGAPLQLSPALSALARHERYLAFEVHGTRFNIGEKYGVLFAQLSLALAGHDRGEILNRLVEMLATRDQSSFGRSPSPPDASRAQSE